MYSLKVFLISSFIALGLSGCQKTSSDTAPGQQSVQENNLKTLAVGVQVAWKEFPAGPQMLEALAVGAIDFGAVGNTPPVFAQAAGKDLKYIGYEVVPQNAQALLIPADSSIRTLADLKGKRIAVQKGSSAHELLAKVLQKAGLSWQDIQPIWLPPADARAAFDKQSIDAWSIWEPYLSAAELDAKAKVLIDGQAFARTYSFYIANPQFIEQHPGATEKILQSLNTADQWVLQHQQQALKIYQQSTGLKQNIAQRVIDKRLKPSPIYSLKPEVVQAQQEIADLFQQVKLIPKSIQVSQVVWVPTPKN